MDNVTLKIRNILEICSILGYELISNILYNRPLITYLNLDDLTILMRMKELRMTMVRWGMSSIRRSFDLNERMTVPIVRNVRMEFELRFEKEDIFQVPSIISSPMPCTVSYSRISRYSGRRLE